MMRAAIFSWLPSEVLGKGVVQAVLAVAAMALLSTSAELIECSTTVA